MTAAQVAKRLFQRGFTNVRPLEGGIDAWIAAGYKIEKAKDTLLATVEQT